MEVKINQTKLTGEQQLALEAKITEVARDRNCSRQQAAYWLLNRQS